MEAQECVQIAPAYGRDYSSAQKAEKDFRAGKDFMIMDIGHKYNGKYCSIQDFAGVKVTIRYNKLERLTVINVEDQEQAT